LFIGSVRDLTARKEAEQTEVRIVFCGFVVSIGYLHCCLCMLFAFFVVYLIVLLPIVMVHLLEVIIVCFSQALLLNMLPRRIAMQLPADSSKHIAEHFESATILFADIVGQFLRFCCVCLLVCWFCLCCGLFVGLMCVFVTGLFQGSLQ
jgi:hypothetical protein